MSVKKFRIEKKDNVAWHGHGSCPVSYAGLGFIIKPSYRAYGDGSGHEFCGAEVYYYGEKVNHFGVKERIFSVNNEIKFIDDLAEEVLTPHLTAPTTKEKTQ